MVVIKNVVRREERIVKHQQHTSLLWGSFLSQSPSKQHRFFIVFPNFLFLPGFLFGSVCCSKQLLFVVFG